MRINFEFGELTCYPGCDSKYPSAPPLCNELAMRYAERCTAVCRLLEAEVA